MSEVHVILSAGHRNGTGGGAPGEPALNLRYANAYDEVLRNEGFTVHYIQRLDDAQDHRPDWYASGLSEVAKKVADIAGGLPASHRVLMLDVHMEAASPSRGMFAIIPDGAGLGGTPANSPDTWANNAASRKLGLAIVREMSKASGIPLRFSKELGLMSEKQTGVATTGSGSRLAMFRHTANLWNRMERLVLEHGNLNGDAATLKADATPGRCARALVTALRDYYDIAPAPAPGPGDFAQRAAPPPLDGEDHTVNGREFIACRRRVSIARDGVPGLQFADPGSPPVRPPYRRGEEVEAAFMVEGAVHDGDRRWWVTVDGTRVPASGTVEKFRKDW